MRPTATLGHQAAPIGLLILGAAILLGGLGSFGIWDPWELEIADRARGLATGDPWPARDPQGAMLAALGFRLFGVHEWAGRLPAALCGVLCVGFAFQLARRFCGLAAGIAAGVVTLSTPLFLLNALPMGGHVLGMALQALAVTSGLFGLTGEEGSRKRLGLVSASLATTALAALVYGALVGALPVLLALAGFAVLGLTGRFRGLGLHRSAALTFIGAAAAISLLVVRAIIADVDGHSIWTGGSPQGHVPPAFDLSLERLFHGLAPWSALLPIALFLPLADGTDEGSRRTARADSLACVTALWCVAGYGAQVIFLARYGEATAFLPIVGVALACAGLLTRLGQPAFPSLFVGIAGTLLCGLILRDFALFPEAPLEGMPLSKFSVPDIFNPKRSWALLLLAFSACLTLPFASEAASARRLDLAAPYRLLKQQARRGTAYKLWLGAISSLLLGCLVLGLFAFVAPGAMHMTSLGRRLSRAACVSVLALPVAIAVLQGFVALGPRLGRYRVAPLLTVAAAIGLYIAHGFLPGLSGHLSPREVYESFNQLAGPRAILAEFKVGGGAANYYVEGEVVTYTDFAKLVEYLGDDSRRWAAVRASDLPSIDARYRRHRGKHLVVADASNATIVLVTNQPLEGRRDENPLRELVLKQPPTIGHPLSARFGGEVKLLGYDLKPRQGATVGAGESMELTWYYRVLRRISTDHKVFVHVDGHGTRVHGDHEPVGGNYPMHLWEPGDIIVDRHSVDVAASTPVGDYELFMGFYRGQQRLPVKDGNQDGSDRVRCGVLRIR